MPGKNIVELAADLEIDGQTGFEATFPPMQVHELMLVMDPRHSGPPVVVLSDGAAGTKEVHPLPLRGREGRYSAQIGGGATYSKIRVTTARDVIAQLQKVKLISGAGHPASPPA
jgi:hypothetical protein